MSNKKRRKLLFIIPSLAGGGAERAVVQLLARLDPSVYDITLLVVVGQGIFFDSLPSTVKVVWLFRCKMPARLFTRLQVRFNSQMVYSWLVRRKIQNNYDVGISFQDSSYTDILFFLGDRIRKKIAWVHSSYLSNDNYSKVLKGRYLQRVKNFRYAKLDKIVFVSHDAMNEFSTLIGHYDHMEVIYNITNTEQIRKLSQENLRHYFDNKVTNLIAVGNLLPVKGYGKLIKAAHQLKQNNIAFKLRILGEGALRAALKNLIGTLELNEHVELLGYLTNPYPLVKNSDIFVMSSVSEGLPTALIEAMVLGLPTVVTNCSGCREVSDDGIYSLMTLNDEDHLYNGLKEMICDKNKRNYFSARSLERANEFDDVNILKSIENVLG